MTQFQHPAQINNHLKRGARMRSQAVFHTLSQIRRGIVALFH